MFERVRGLDAAFLSQEGGNNMPHVAQTSVVGPIRSPEPLSYSRVRQLITDRLDILLPFGKQLLHPPSAVGQLAWMEDPGSQATRVAA